MSLHVRRINMNDMERKLKDFQNNQLELDDTFMFHCNQCGKCCMNRDDILITPRDIYRMSKELGITTMEFVATYCEWHSGYSSKIPIVVLKSKEKNGECSLLKDHKCSVHSSKPLICALHPIGRGIAMTNEDEKPSDIDTGQIKFFKTECCSISDKSECHTVRSWLEDFGIPIEDEFFIRWTRAITELSLFLKKVENYFDKEKRYFVNLMVLVNLYIYYDTEKDFLMQFQNNFNKTMEFVKREYEVLVNE